MKRRDRASSKLLNKKNKLLPVKDSVFLEADYTKYGNFSAVELLQLFLMASCVN